MNKCNIPQKKILLLSNKFSQDTVIVYKKVDEWHIEQHWVTKKRKKQKQTNKKKLETCRQNGSQTGNSKVTAVVLIHLRCLLFVIFRRIKCNCWFCSLADSVLKFSTEIYIFIKHLTFFDRYSCFILKKQIWCKVFVHGIL